MSNNERLTQKKLLALSLKLAHTPSLLDNLKMRANKAKIHALAGALAANELYIYLVTHPLAKSTGLSKSGTVKSLQGCIMGLGMLVGASHGFVSPLTLKKQVTEIFTQLEPNKTNSAASHSSTYITNKKNRRETSKLLRKRRNSLSENYQSIFSLGMAIGMLLTRATKQLALNPTSFFNTKSKIEKIPAIINKVIPCINGLV